MLLWREICLSIPPELIDFIKKGKLDQRKQQATYVGLERGRKGSVKVNSRISVPTTIKLKETKQLISWINAEFVFIYESVKSYDHYFGVTEMDLVMLSPAGLIIFDWTFKSRTKSRKHQAAHNALHQEEYLAAEQQFQSNVAAVFKKNEAHAQENNDEILLSELSEKLLSDVKTAKASVERGVASVKKMEGN